MRRFTWISIAIGAILLALGVASFGWFALQGRGNWSASFLFTMSSLLFFNLPTVVNRRRAGRAKLDQVTGRPSGESERAL